MQKEMSKLQIRAEVLMMLQQLSVFEDIPKSETDKYLTQFQSFENIDDILEILLKELPRSDSKKSQIIAYFLIELGNLEKLKDKLWAYIKDSGSSDDLKDLSGVILKSLGDSSTPDELLSYLNNPEELVDKETQKLLETASINPEAQIDFLDFLFSLPPDEQINLINSMTEDFTNKYLANVFIPALESNPSEKMSAIIIKALGEIRSPYAVASLNDISKYSKNENLKKLAKKSLNMLKISGVNMEEALKKPLGSEICKISNIYKCYASIIDGAGNQGIIVSRKKENGDILTFSTVINDIDGIIDCFGFYGISGDDYIRIINKFQGQLAAAPVSPEYCKYKLLQAENTNKTLNNPIRYEYLSWKSLLSDIDPISIEYIAKKLPEWSNPAHLKNTYALFNHPEFKHWFLGNDHSNFLKSFLSKILQDVLKNRDNYINTPDILLNQLENNVNLAIPKVFNSNLIILYKLRLSEVAYLFDIQGMENLRNIAASIVMQLRNITKPDNSTLFFECILKKSVIEYLLGYQYRLEQKIAPVPKSLWKKKEQIKDIDFMSQEISRIIDILITEWRERND